MPLSGMRPPDVECAERPTLGREKSMSSDRRAADRRRFLQFLAASPLLSLASVAAYAADGVTPSTKLPDPVRWADLDPQELIKSPKEAINVFDFEPVARKNVPPAHFGYMASGIDDEVTLRANRA